MYNTRELAFTKKLLRLVDLDQYPQLCTQAYCQLGWGNI